VIPPRGSTRIEPGDHVFFVLARRVRPLVEHLFTGTQEETRRPPAAVEFPLRGDTRLADIQEFYGLHIAAEDEAMTLDEFLRARLGDRLETGRGVDLGPVKLRVQALAEGRVEQVGMVIHDGPPAGGPASP
jgi:cell volume regulation protein A